MLTDLIAPFAARSFPLGRGVLLLISGLALVGASPAGTTRTQTIPVVRQTLRNDCEAAALSMLLAAKRVHVSQLQLQRELPHDGPLDPVRRGSRLIWGDPDRGFVGRAEGGGSSGGYGVYTRPIRELARRHGVPLANVTGRPDVLYRRLRAGRPAMVWVGLSDGPYLRWISPAGKQITGNFGEHTVVLTAMRGNRISLNDPLSGTREVWSRATFEIRWARLGRRALGL